jgi:hypothetical protein
MRLAVVDYLNYCRVSLLCLQYTQTLPAQPFCGRGTEQIRDGWCKLWKKFRIPYFNMICRGDSVLAVIIR